MICVSIQEKDFTRCREIISTCKMAEIRGDLCNFTTAQIEQLVKEHQNLLYTHRIAGSSIQQAYTQMTAAIKKGVRYVDVEIEAPIDYLEQIKSYARVNGCSLVISYHNFEGTQSLEELQSIYDICRRKGADIVKIVTTAHNISDANRVMQLYNYSKSDKELAPDNFLEHGEDSGSLSNSFGQQQASLVAFCMGEAGKFTRDLCLELGAPYTYAALDEESCTAPGQYTKEEMERLYNQANFKFITPKANDTVFCKKNPVVEIPCSKSIAQRAILAAALADGTSVLENFEPCNDILGAIEVIKALGSQVEISGRTLTVRSGGTASLKSISEIFTGESGLLTRLLIPMATYLSSNDKEITITGHGSILKRNMQESADAVAAAGANCRTSNGHLPFTVEGGIQRREIEFSGKESSQIVSGFLMTLPLLQEDSTLTITDPTSLPYIELTLKVMKAFGVEVTQEDLLPGKMVYKISGRQKYSPVRMYMDSDWSSAANFAVAGALTDGVTLKGMPLGEAQADEFILQLLQELGYGVEKEANGSLYDIKITPATDTVGTPAEFDLTHCPDLFPIATVLACNNNREIIFTGVERLAQKESNRAETIYHELAKLGYRIRIEGDKMYLCGKEKRKKEAPVLGCGHNDHRIAMALYIASLKEEYQVLVDEIKCIDKSFPSFVERLNEK